MSAISGVSAYSLTNTAITTTGNDEDSDQDLFMKVLVEQLKNQDPTSPMDSTEWISQMAQFTSLEELGNINDTLDESAELDLILAQSMNNTMASTMIGKEISAYGNTVHCNGEDEVEIQFELEDSSSDIKVTITDEDGTVIREITSEEYFTAGKQSITWNGKDSDGVVVEEGTYTIKVTAVGSDGVENECQTYLTGIVTAVRFESGSAILVVNDSEVSFSEVMEIGLGES